MLLITLRGMWGSGFLGVGGGEGLKIWQKAEEQTWKILFYLGVDALKQSYEVSFLLLMGMRRWAHKIWQKLKAEEQTWQILFYLGMDVLKQSFEVSF